MVEFISNKGFEKKFNQLLKDSIEVAIGSAFLNIEGIELLTDYLKKIGKITNKKIRILLSEKFHEKREVRAKILENLRAIPYVEVKIYSEDDSRFHAKIFIFSTEKQVNIISGSYNITGAGIHKNVEAGYFVSGKKEESFINEAVSFFNENWNKGMSYETFLKKEAMQPEPRFNKGDKVYVTANPDKKGIIQDEPTPLNASFLYSVYFSIDEKANYREEQLSLLKKEENTPIISKIIDNQLEPARTFLQALTLLKLENPLTDNLYAFLASRTEFNPHQFKPILKFLKSPFQRLLIADEVGVGKTIEAGIIYTELKARNDLENVLIVCPNALMPKWRAEMKSRFDEDFEILGPERLRYILNEVSKGMDLTNFRGICSLQLLRIEGYLTKLKELGLHFDLVIVDEAHHMRNRGNSYELGMTLSYNSDSMVFLTATPLQLGNEDFFNLMHILLPEEFKSFDYFEALIEPNQYLNATYTLLKSKDALPGEALNLLKNIEKTAIADRFTKNPDYNAIKETLSSLDFFDITTKLELQNKLNQLNPLSHVYTRTKKKDVMVSPKREPHFIHVKYSPEEKRFYDLVIEYAKYRFAQRNMGNQQGVGFATIMAQRQVASCIPAMINYLKELLETKKTAKLTEDDDYIADDSFIEQYPGEEYINEKEAKFIGRLVEIGEAIGDRDTKFDAFINTLNKLLSNKEVNKVMVFSYFRKTLEYLKKKLSKKGFKVGLIYGGIDLEERERITEQLRSGEIQVLLSSEVGGEGLDFQFCNCMINYDLPWNPMKVEQRIGRLDRYGQMSPKILIYNFSVEDTIETRIFGRLYQRIQIFERYIGELENILGKEISDLTKLIISTKLTPEEEEERLQDIQNTIELKKIELKDFEKERAKFMGQDDFFTEEINHIQKTNRFISSDEIKNFVQLFLEEQFPKTKLNNKEEKIYSLKASKELITFLTKQKLNLIQTKKSELSKLIRELEKGELELTFDSKTACYFKNLEFITLRHPLVKCIISFIRNKALLPAGRLTIENNEHIGDYLFLTYIIKIDAAKTALEKHTVVINLRTMQIDSLLSEEFGSLIFKAKKTNKESAMVPLKSDIFACEKKALEYITTIQSQREKELLESNNFLIDSQIESQKAFFNQKIQLAKKILEETKNEKIKRMRLSQIDRLSIELEEKIKKLEKKRMIDISFNMVAGGILHILPPEVE